MRTSYNGWTASKDKTSLGIVPLEVCGHSFPGGIKGGDVAVIFTHFLERYDAQVEPLTSPGPDDEWGYAYRQNRNADNLTCHASGTAVDVNAQRHPNGKANTLSATHLAALRTVLAFYEGVIKWGGDFTGTRDEMHYELHGTEADAKRIADKIRNATKPATIVQEDDMPYIVSAQGAHYVTNFLTKRPMHSVEEEKALRALGIKPVPMPEDAVLAIPDVKS